MRFENKGHRFVVADGINEDELVETDLKNPIYYHELQNDPIETDKNTDCHSMG